MRSSAPLPARRDSMDRAGALRAGSGAVHGTAPLPANYVGLLYERRRAQSPFAGTNFGTHIAILPKYDVDDRSREAPVLAGSSHCPRGGALLLERQRGLGGRGRQQSLVGFHRRWRANRQAGRSYEPARVAYAPNIAGLESLGIVSRGDAEFWCNYSLGEIGSSSICTARWVTSRFRQGFRTLYLASELEDDDDHRGTSVGIEHVRRSVSAPEDGAASAVIARWYDGTEPYDLSQLNDSPVDPSLPSINGRIDEAYIVTEDGRAGGVLLFRAGRQRLGISHTERTPTVCRGGPREVQSRSCRVLRGRFCIPPSRTAQSDRGAPIRWRRHDWFSIGSVAIGGSGRRGATS